VPAANVDLKVGAGNVGHAAVGATLVLDAGRPSPNPATVTPFG
jgi:hypothetical protein